MKITVGKLESLFAFIVIIFGLLIIYLTPPMCSPDENAHFINSYSITTGNLFPVVENGHLGKYLPDAVYNFVVDNNGKLNGRFDEEYTYEEQYLSSWLVQKESEQLFYASGSVAISPIAYLVSSAGMFLYKAFCKIFAPGYILPYNMLVCGKLANLLFYSIVIYYALKITPYCKNVIFMIVLMPMSIFLGASLNYDSILIAITTYYFAVLMKILHSDNNYQVTNKDIISVCFAAFFMVGIKQMYAPLLALLFVVPIKKFKDKKQYFTAIGAVIVTAVIAYFPNIVLQILNSRAALPSPQYVIDQKQYVFQNIFRFLGIIIHTFVSSMPYFMTSFIGSLGNLDTNFILPFILLFAIILCLIAIFDISRIEKTDIKLRIGSAILIILIIVAASYTMYIGWTSIPEIGGVGYQTVSGLQGRYFIPLFLFGIVIFSNNSLQKIKFTKDHMEEWEKRIDYLTKMTMLVMNILTIWILISRFYI